MKQTSGPTRTKPSAEATLKDIRRAMRRQFSAEEKIRIVLDGLRGEESIAELCRREGIASSMCCDPRRSSRWRQSPWLRLARERVWGNGRAAQRIGCAEPIAHRRELGSEAGGSLVAQG